MTFEQLSQLRGKATQIHFKDGFAVTGEIVSVAPDRLAEQVVYKVTEVLSPAPSGRSEIQPGGYYASDLEEIVSAHMID